MSKAGTEIQGTPGHVREAIAIGSMMTGFPGLAGLVIGDCSCGATYIGEGPGEFDAAEAAHRAHVAAVASGSPERLCLVEPGEAMSFVVRGPEGAVEFIPGADGDLRWHRNDPASGVPCRCWWVPGAHWRGSSSGRALASEVAAEAEANGNAAAADLAYQRLAELYTQLPVAG
jgi:hypothetical protein